MGEGALVYSLQASRGNGSLVRLRGEDTQSASEYGEEEDLFLPQLQTTSKSNPLRLLVMILFAVLIFVSGALSHLLLTSLGAPVSPHKIDNVASVVRSEKVREYHIDLTSSSHIAGSAENYRLAEYVRDRFKEFAFDKVEMKNYSVRLPYPNESKPNSVNLLDSNGSVTHSCASQETPVTEFERTHPTTPLFNAWSKTGSVTAPYIFVNGATDEDFDYLESHNITVKGKIALVRLGGMFRGNQVENAAARGAVGAVLFKDLNYPEEKTRFPESEWAPLSSGQRGSIYVGDGDGDSEGWPSVPDSPLKKEGALKQSAIISQPITGEDAAVLLRALPETSGVTPDWSVGVIAGEQVRIGGTENGPQLKVTVSHSVKRVNITNVIGTITGSVEPDRWVILGNHRDAWTYGAIDPNSGTAAMLEVGRSLGAFLEKGWRPRRTIKLASWDAEEWGLMGSIEWVEEYRHLLSSRAVIYVNTDIAEGGKCEEVAATGSPLYEGLVRTVLNKVNGLNTTDPLPLSGSGSDMFEFYCYAGVSVLDIGCNSACDVYHTMHDNQHLMELVDSDYKNLAKVASVLAQVVVSVSESVLIPGDIERYTDQIANWWLQQRPGLVGVLKRVGEDEGALAPLDRVIKELSNAGQQFMKSVYDPLAGEDEGMGEVRKVNDALLLFDRAFILPGTGPLPGTPSYYSRHLLVSPSAQDLYSGSGFPSLQWLVLESGVSREEVLYQLEIVRWALKAATDVLLD